MEITNVETVEARSEMDDSWGLSRDREVEARGAAFVVVSPHCYTTGVGLAATMQVMAASPATEWLAFDPTEFPLYEQLFTSSLDVTDGTVALPTDPGLGVDLDASVVDEYRVE